MNNETIYIVTSLHRSGSSMMMRCLEAGGIEAVCDKSADSTLNDWLGSDGYPPNPNGFYQSPRDLLQRQDFVEYMSGKVVKIYLTNLKNLPPANYKVIFMRRNKNEILASMLKITKGKDAGREQRNVENSETLIPNILSELATRQDMSFVQVNFAQVVKNPLLEFAKLKNNFGIPIDIQAAASMVEPSLYRFKLENI
jgi:hypothetical protein